MLAILTTLPLCIIFGIVCGGLVKDVLRKPQHDLFHRHRHELEHCRKYHIDVPEYLRYENE